jgi:hypothetical protein
MTIVQFIMLAVGLGWITLGGLALYKRDVDYPGQIFIRIGRIRLIKPHRVQYKGGCALIYAGILIVCGVIAILLSLVIR